MTLFCCYHVRNVIQMFRTRRVIHHYTLQLSVGKSTQLFNCYHVGNVIQMPRTRRVIHHYTLQLSVGKSTQLFNCYHVGNVIQMPRTRRVIHHSTLIKGGPPLHNASIKNIQSNTTVVSELLAHQQCNINIHNNIGDTLLHTAIKIWQDNTIVQLLSRKECNPNTQNKEGDTPLHIAAKYVQVHTIVQLLSCKECNPNIQNKEGDTPLHIGCYRKSSSIVKPLLIMRCSTNIPNKKGATAQDIPLNEDGDRLLYIACQWGDADIVRYLITDEGCNPNILNSVSGNTPLHFAAKHGQTDIILHLPSVVV